jgi:hypothetical protein
LTPPTRRTSRPGTGASAGSGANQRGKTNDDATFGRLAFREEGEFWNRYLAKPDTKIESYCKFAALSDQVDEAVQQQDTKKAKELSQKAAELQRKLGPEFTALAGNLQDMNLNSQDAREIASIIGKLDEFCGD